MENIRKHKKVWTVIAIVASIALIISSFLPFLTLIQQ